MLKVRVIPTMLWKNFTLVKGEKFNSWRRVGAVMPSIKVYNRRDVDELVLVDIVASQENELVDYESLGDFANESFVPFTVGGGVRSVEDGRKLLQNGADKFSINTAAYDDPELIETSAKEFGVQCVVASIDVLRHEGSLVCMSHSGTTNQHKDPVEWAKEMASRGAGEILLTSIDRDGTMTGYDLDLVEKVVNAVNVPVIAAGGAGNYQHMIDAVSVAGASAVAAASIFHFTEQTPREAKLAMRDAGIPVRLT